MPRTAKRTGTRPLSAPELAKQAADQYFDALTADTPLDNAPGDLNLVAAFTKIQDAYLRDDPSLRDADEALRNEDAAMHAGYLLGIEIGRRLGGVR